MRASRTLVRRSNASARRAPSRPPPFPASANASSARAVSPASSSERARAIAISRAAGAGTSVRSTRTAAVSRVTRAWRTRSQGSIAANLPPSRAAANAAAALSACPAASNATAARTASSPARAAGARARNGVRELPPWRLRRSETHWDADRAGPRRATSRRHARGVPRDGANRRDRWRCDQDGRKGLPAPQRHAPPTPPRSRARRRASPFGSPHPRQHALKLGARRRCQTIPAEARLILEIQHETLGRVGPTQHALPAAIHPVREVQYLVRLAQGDEDLAPLGEPAGLPLILEPHVRLLDAPEVIVDSLVLRRDGRRVRGFPEGAPDFGAMVGGGAP